MKLKLDENLGRSARDELVGAAHDVSTVPEQGLTSATDEQLIKRAGAEGRALVTLDLDLANPLRFPPRDYAGIAVLRPPPQASAQSILTLIRTLAAALEKEPLAGRLWIVEPARIRIYDPPDHGSDP